MKKQSGFTLIELMVVMAIIAILAIAGLAAYVGYIKQARDTTRISDLSVINKALLAVITNTGKSPTVIDEADNTATVIAAIKAVNNGAILKDPIGTETCYSSGATPTSNQKCAYYYRQCDGGGGFVVSTRFESKTNVTRYTTDGIDTIDPFEGTDASNEDSFWSLGACTSLCTASTECVIVAHTEIKLATP